MMKKNILHISVTALFLSALILSAGCSKEKDSDGDNPPESVLFEGAFDSSGTCPPAQEITYLTEEGSLMQTEVYPGQIIIHVSGPSAEQVRSLVVKNGGRIVVQVPKAGHYMVEIDASKTSQFLNAMYDSPLVKMAFPNRPSVVKGTVTGSALKSEATGDAGSIIQTIDMEDMIGCDPMSHLDAVAAVAGNAGVNVHTNDVTISGSNSNYDVPFRKTIELIEYSYLHKTPVVINISMGGRDEVAGESEIFYRYMCYILDSISGATPGILDNAVIMIACTNNHVDETQTINNIVSHNPNAVFWDHLYFVGGQGGAAGCTGGGGTGYAAAGTGNYLAAPSCDQPIPGSQCVVTGNSFAVPQLTSTVARTWELMKQDGQEMKVSEIAAKLWEYQTLYSGQVPTPEQLRDYIKGIVPQALYDGTWRGTFRYRASVPQDEGPDLIINTSFTLNFTLKSEVNLPGYPHLLRFQAITCSDPRFGATVAVVPDAKLSMAFLPGTYSSDGEQGMGFLIEFPNGSSIMTNNNMNGCFTVNPSGTVIASTALVEGDAFLATTNIGDSNDPASGPGQYAYNWCTFKSWKMERVTASD